jgi:hypothetical protein
MEPAKIQELLRKYPPKLLDSGNFRLPPARLAFPSGPASSAKPKDLFPSPRGSIKEEKYIASFLFPKACDVRPVAQHFMKAAVDLGFSQAEAQVFAKERLADQAKKAAKGQNGYEAGAYHIVAKSDWEPKVINLQGHDILDPRQFYGGCWVIGLVNIYRYEKPSPGATWGLQSIVKIADDESFVGGGPVDPREELGDILDATADAGALFGDQPSSGAAAVDPIFG